MLTSRPSDPIVDADLPRIAREEFLERQERLRAIARERGLGGVLVFSRGATTQDQYTNVYYLSNFYTHYPAVPDAAGRWAAKGCVGFIVPVEGPTTLVTDIASAREDLTVADAMDSDQDVIAAAIRALEPIEGSIGVLSGGALAWQWYRRITDVVGERFVDIEDAGPELRLIKSPAEQALLRAAGKLGVRAVEAVMDAAVPGATEAEVAAAGIDAIVRGGGMFYGISLSTGPYAHMYSQSQPAPFDGRRRLEAGDMARVDLYGSVDGYLFDFGRSRVVGRTPTPTQQMLLDASRDSVKAGIEALRPGNTLGDVAAAASASLSASPFAASPEGLAAEFNSWGHSLGLNWEAPYIDEGNPLRIEPNMCFAIEKRVAIPGVGGATFEENVLVTEAGVELLTPARDAYDEA